jgi:hypothetical protein
MDNRQTKNEFFFPIGGGGTPVNPDQSIQFNKVGVFGGDSNLEWDYTNEILKVGANPGGIGTFLFGDETSLPAYLQGYTGALNLLSSPEIGGGLNVAVGIETANDLGIFAAAYHFRATAIEGDAIIPSGSSNVNVTGIAGFATPEDNTCDNCIVLGVLGISNVRNAGSNLTAIGVQGIVTGTGITTAYSLEALDAVSDPITGTSVGLHIGLGISGATTFAIKSDSVAPSFLAGSLEVASFSLSSLPPAYANNAAAILGGLVAGNIYRTGLDPDLLAIVH